MHPALLVTDVLRVIFPLLLQDGRSSALALSVSAKIFLETGMEHIWEELDDIRPLFRILLDQKLDHNLAEPSAIWSPPSEEQWRRFDFYATKIRILRASVGERYSRGNIAGWETSYRLHIPIPFILGLAQECSQPGRSPLLPNLRTLDLSGDAKITRILSRIFLSSNVSILHLNCNESLPLAAQSISHLEDLEVDFFESVEKACLHLISLRLSGIFIRDDNGEPPVNALEWSKIFPSTLTDLTLEKDVFEYPYVAEHLCRLPNLLRLEVGPGDPNEYEESSIEITSFPVLVDLTAPASVITKLAQSIPKVRRIITRMSPWSVGELSQDGSGIHLLRPRLEKACPELESFTVVLARERFMICGTAMFARIKNIQTLEGAWDKIKVEYEPFES